MLELSVRISKFGWESDEFILQVSVVLVLKQESGALVAGVCVELVDDGGLCHDRLVWHQYRAVTTCYLISNDSCSRKQINLHGSFIINQEARDVRIRCPVTLVIILHLFQLLLELAQECNVLPALDAKLIDLVVELVEHGGQLRVDALFG